MPTEAVWIMVTVPKKEHEKEIKQLRRKNMLNNISGIKLLLKLENFKTKSYNSINCDFISLVLLRFERRKF
jgi:hypothetical protein